MNLKGLCFLVFIAVLVPQPLLYAQEPEAEWYGKNEYGVPQLHLYFFWTRQCPHCSAALPFVEQLGTSYPWLRIHSLEITRDPGNAKRYIDMAAQLGGKADSVPAFLFCEFMLTGYESAETTGEWLDQVLNRCYRQVQRGHMDKPLATEEKMGIQIPLLGDVDSEKVSLFVFTLVIAGLDAFNPCAFFVLLFLLSLLTRVRSRMRLLLVGGVFVFFSGLIYFVFMAAWLNAFMLMEELQAITVIAGAIAVTMALINIKDYFWFRKGISLSIPESSKPNIYERARRLINAASMPSMLLSTAILAAAANSYELLCTAGFPMVYTRALTLNELTAAEYYMYLLFYNLVYVIPLALIVVIFAFLLGVRNLTEAQGRSLKLLSGLMMLGLGALLIVAPEWLQYMETALILLGGAICLTLIIVFISRMITHSDITG